DSRPLETLEARFVVDRPLRREDSGAGQDALTAPKIVGLEQLGRRDPRTACDRFDRLARLQRDRLPGGEGPARLAVALDRLEEGIETIGRKLDLVVAARSDHRPVVRGV